MNTENQIFEKAIESWNKENDRYCLANIAFFLMISASIIVFNFQASLDPNKLLLRGACIFGILSTIVWIGMNLRIRSMNKEFSNSIDIVYSEYSKYKNLNSKNIIYDFMNIMALMLGAAWIFLLKFTWSL